MATYTVTLKKSYPYLASYTDTSITYDSSTIKWSPGSITKPTWNSGRKRFEGYYKKSGSTWGNLVIQSNGWPRVSSIGSNFDAYDKWSNILNAALILDGSTSIAEIVYDGGVWYADYPNRIPLDSTHPIQIPQKELYRFIGCYSTKATSGTKYINADGTPTAEFLALSAESSDISIYAVYELVSVKITISSSNGTYAYKTFYQSLTADANGKYGYYTDSACPESSRIYGIPVPTRELYTWGGLREGSGNSSALWANANGTFTDAFLNRSAATDTAYGNFWTQVSYKLTVNANGGSATVAAYYTHITNGNVYTDWLCETAALTTLPIPTKNGSRFLGYYSANSGGTKYVEYDGTIQSALNTKKSTITITAQWRTAGRTLTLDPNGGTGGGTIYFDTTASSFFDATSATITSVTPPTYTGNAFTGYFTEATGGTQVIGANGVISNSYTPSGNDTLYAQWTIGKSTVTIDAIEGHGGTNKFYCDLIHGGFYADSELTEPISSVTLPTTDLFNTLGIYTYSVGGTQIIGANGVISQSFSPTDEYVTLYAQYSRRCYQMAVDAGGGTSAVDAVYHAPSSSVWYSDDTLTTPITNVGVPTRAGYTFGGYSYGGTQVIGSNGDILGAAVIEDSFTASASWTAITYTLTFNPNGGTTPTASKLIVFGATIGALPTPTRSGRKFESWQIDEVDIGSTDRWYYSTNKTAVAKWKDNFGGTVDYFSFASNANLMLVSSESGTGRQVTNLWNGAYEQGSNLINPVCVFRIKSSGNVTIQLGKAFRSGYMITDFEYKTGADQEPTLTVRGVANEGANAINLYNVTLAVAPDHIAQDPFHAITSGGGELVEMTSGAKCDPVVPYENNMPCASDVVHGRLVVSGRTNAYFGESAPTIGNSFIDSGVPSSESDVDFTSYAFAAEKRIV